MSVFICPWGRLCVRVLISTTAVVLYLSAAAEARERIFCFLFIMGERVDPMTAPILGDWPSIVSHVTHRSETSALGFLVLQATAKADPEQTSQFLETILI